MARTVRVAAISLATVDGLVEANYDRALKLGQIALYDRPDLILFPAAFAAGYCAHDLTPYADRKNSPQLRRLRRLSRAGSCMVVAGYLERSADGVRNTVAVYDQGQTVGYHYKHSLWPDAKRPYRNELSLLIAGEGLDVFDSRLGVFAVLTCYESTLKENWAEVTKRVDFVLSPYNCEIDPGRFNLKFSKKHGLPSAWADRTGMVYAGDEVFVPNLGTAGVCDAKGKALARSAPGVEAVVVADMVLGRKKRKA